MSSLHDLIVVGNEKTHPDEAVMQETLRAEICSREKDIVNEKPSTYFYSREDIDKERATIKEIQVESDGCTHAQGEVLIRIAQCYRDLYNTVPLC